MSMTDTRNQSGTIYLEFSAKTPWRLSLADQESRTEAIFSQSSAHCKQSCKNSQHHDIFHRVRVRL